LENLFIVKHSKKGDEFGAGYKVYFKSFTRPREMFIFPLNST